MAETGNIKPLIHTNPVRAINKEPAKKEQNKKKKSKNGAGQDKENSRGHVNEYI